MGEGANLTLTGATSVFICRPKDEDITDLPNFNRKALTFFENKQFMIKMLPTIKMKNVLVILCVASIVRLSTIQMPR